MVLPPLTNSWIIIIVRLYIAFNRTPNIDCYWVGAVPKVSGHRLKVSDWVFGPFLGFSEAGGNIQRDPFGFRFQGLGLRFRV